MPRIAVSSAELRPEAAHVTSHTPRGVQTAVERERLLPRAVPLAQPHTLLVTGHRSNTLDSQCGATITDSSASDTSLPLCKRAEGGKQLEIV